MLTLREISPVKSLRQGPVILTVLTVEDLIAREVLRDCIPLKSLRLGPGVMQVIIDEHFGANLTHDETFTNENYKYTLRECSPLKRFDGSYKSAYR